MSETDDGPHCPECGEPIGARATYCMHCSADLTEEREAADVDGDGTWDRDEPVAADRDDALLAPDGLVDNTLTAIVGVVGGILVGVLGTVALLFVTGSGWAIVFGLLAWLGATAYLARRRTVQGAIAKSGYAVAVVLLVVPLIAFSPVATVDGGIEERGGLFVVLLLFVAVPAAIAAGVGWIASRFVPIDGSEG